jgi:carboxymethylenebutenolidase
VEHAGEPLRIASSGGSFAANLFHPEIEPAPAVLIVPEMYGVNGYINNVARDYARHGFLTLVIDVLWRTQPELVLSYGGPDTVRAHAIHDAFEFGDGAADMQAAIDRLRALPACWGMVGVVGFCLGGTLAFVAALRTNADAAVDYYGSRAIEFAADVASITTPLMLHTGSSDTAFPAGEFDRLETALRPNRSVTSYVYDGARHAFANDVRADRYHPHATALSQARTFAFFDAHLRRPAAAR